MEDQGKTVKDLNSASPISNIVNPPVDRPKSKLPIIIALIIGALILLVNISFGFYLLKQKASKQTVCTMEAKICPDGTSVGRSGPKCEFAPCPIGQKLTPTESNQNQTACNTDADCKRGTKCITIGPIIAGQTVKKVCSQPGIANPL